MCSHPYIVYALIDTDTKEVLYIGQGTHDRIKHLTGISHNRKVNEAFFTRNTEARILCYVEKQSIALTLEENLIEYFNPSCNTIKKSSSFRKLLLLSDLKPVTGLKIKSNYEEIIKSNCPYLINDFILMSNGIYDYNKYMMKYTYEKMEGNYVIPINGKLEEFIYQTNIYSKVYTYIQTGKGFTLLEIQYIWNTLINNSKSILDNDSLFQSLNIVSPSMYSQLNIIEVAA